MLGSEAIWNLYMLAHIGGVVEYQAICWSTEYSFHTATASVRQNTLDRGFIFTINSIELVHERYHRCWPMFLHEMLFIHGLEVDWFYQSFFFAFFFFHVSCSHGLWIALVGQIVRDRRTPSPLWPWCNATSSTRVVLPQRSKVPNRLTRDTDCKVGFESCL